LTRCVRDRSSEASVAGLVFAWPSAAAGSRAPAERDAELVMPWLDLKGARSQTSFPAVDPA
jgi:hypothetical protein